jgi:3-phenylpropionate/trans-cinnamate dioxygenase ferredoxin subunit|tara:strand:+ start:376 stop:747 length:372 start_codon:yes stop_codon:yes gene_type:complete
MNETTTEERKWVDIASGDDVAEGEVKTFTIDAQRIAVARANGQLYAVQDLCSHDDGPLGDGGLEEFSIVCPRHGAKFDVRTGAAVAMPAIAPIETFPAMEKDGRIHVAVKAQGDDRSIADDSW